MLVGLRSRKHIPSFELVKAANVEDVLAALSKPGRSAVMAGGLDLIDRLKHGEHIDRIVHLAGMPELSGIKKDDDAVSIGALTTHAAIVRDTMLAELLPDLPAIWRGIASPRVRHVGTLGGNLMSATPHYDAMPALLALGANAIVVDRTGQQSAFALNQLAACEGVILERVSVPAAHRRRLFTDRSLHPAVSVYLGASVDDGVIHSARMAVGCCYANAVAADLPLSGAAISSLGANAGALARDAVASLPEPLSDGLASSSYRRRMIEVFTRRLLIKLGSQP